MFTATRELQVYSGRNETSTRTHFEPWRKIGNTALWLSLAGVLAACSTSQSQEITPEPTTSAPAQLPASPKPPFFGDIKIEGDELCVSQTEQALTLLETKAPEHYAVVAANLDIIECTTDQSVIRPDIQPVRYEAGDATRQAGTIWYASTIAHDATHADLYSQYHTEHPAEAVPYSIYTGRQAEVLCLAGQTDALKDMGAAQTTIDYVQHVIDTDYYDVPLRERWW